MTALRELVGTWRDAAMKHLRDAQLAIDDDELKSAATHATTAQAQSDCADDLAAALSAQEERVCGKCVQWMGHTTRRDDSGAAKCNGFIVAYTSENESCSRWKAKE